MIVELGNGSIHYLRWAEPLQRIPIRPRHSRRLIFEECLVGCHLSRLRRARFSLKFLQRLPSQPAEFVVVPHVDEWPAGAPILQVRIVQVGAINGAVPVKCSGNVKVTNFFRVRIAHNVSQSAVIHSLRAIFRIPHQLINEIA